ncbi:omptin family outer membrane protease [Gellertiella hungarica]|uniref:Omptin n=1 Tax=Gellertiella hungarica TaxID=1572859 RepID=A0A7W6J666_9HYPH|nr:omptin family outer membrane protease [Gellertiella hungarica]MBB4065521.1 omptin [Gellertiella hungarica]
MNRLAALAGAVALGASATAALAADATVYTNADNSFSLSGGIGLMNIDAGEFVYDGDYTISRLDWESRGVVLFTLNGEAELPHDFLLKASLSTGIKGNNHMTDYDWIYPDNAGPNGPDDWTDRSQHPDTELDHYWSGSLEIGKQVYATEDTRLSLGAGFKYTDVKWSAVGGSYIYSGSAFRDTVDNFGPNEKVISYRQQIPVLYATAGVSHDVGNWTLGGALKGGLSLGIRDTDDHWLRDLRFYDDMKAAPMLGADLSASYHYNENTSFYLAGGFEKIFHARGDVETINTVTGDSAKTSDASGADFRSMQISFGVNMKF